MRPRCSRALGTAGLSDSGQCQASLPTQMPLCPERTGIAALSALTLPSVSHSVANWKYETDCAFENGIVLSVVLMKCYTNMAVCRQTCALLAVIKIPPYF